MTFSFERSFLLLAIGVLAITTAVLVKIFQPYDLIFKWKLLMEKDGEIFNLWEKPPIDLYLKVYLFNITNAEAFLAGRERLKVEQVGPYVYKEIMTHENVTFNSNDTMSAIPSHPLVWQEHLSEGNKENDTVIMVDIAVLSIIHKTFSSSMMPSLFAFALHSLKPIAKMTAREFMFGYPSSLTKFGNKLMPNWIFFESVGLIDRMYDFNGDFETFHTGAANPALAGLYTLYRGEPNLRQWDDEHCSNIELASDGTKFRSFLQPNDSLKFFRKSMCRPINLHRVGEPEIHGSLEGYKYVFEENAMDNGAINKKNKCYCRKNYCQPRGLLDVSECYYTFPISLSYPHFMDGDEGLVKNVTGIAPNPDLHSSAFIIQPHSGLPLSLSVKVQINMHFTRMPSTRNMKHFNYLTVPMLWFDITMPQLPKSLDNRFNFYINYLRLLDPIGFYGGLALGIVLLVYSVTRATLHMSAINQADKVKYAKANLLQSTNNVYNPCEMKLIEQDEKTNFKDNLPKHQLLQNSSESDSENQQRHQKLGKGSKQKTTRSFGNLTDLEQNLLFKEIDLKKKRHSSYILEMEPALSEDDEDIDDEYRDTESSGSISRNSTASSCVDIHTDDSQSSHKLNQQASLSSKSSGLASSLCNSQFAEEVSTDFIWPMNIKRPNPSDKPDTST